MYSLTLRRFISTCCLATGLFSVSAAWAGWTLDNADSTVQFITTKNNAVAEVHSFKQLSGSIDADGAARIEIDLDSVDTLIPIRDERMREHLFRTASFPRAVIGARVDLKAAEAINPGDEQLIETTLGVSLHGQDVKLPAKLRITALGNGRYAVSTAQPLLLRATDFELLAGIEKLRQIAGLESISSAVPVTVYLVWNK